MKKNNFLSEKLNRALWVAYIEQNKINEAIDEYNRYIQNLSALKKNDEITKEIEYSKNLILEKLKAKCQKFLDEKDYYNAIFCCKYLFDNKPDDEDNLNNYIKCLSEVKQHDLQVLLAKYYVYAFDKPKCYKLLSDAYEKNQDYELSTQTYKKYLMLEKRTKLEAGDYNMIACNYFNSYINKGEQPQDAENAVKYFKKAVKLIPDNKIYLRNCIVAAMKTKDFKTEQSLWFKYIELGYADKDDEFTYSASCIRNGDFKEWEKYYGSRFETKNPTFYPKFNKPEWTGTEDLSDKTLLVHYEQGFGDNFLMFGYMPRLVKMAKHVIYYIQNEIYELVRNNEYGVEIQCHNTVDAQNLKFDYHIPCMSIPIVLKLDKTNIAVDGGYIKPDKKLVEQFKKKYFDTPKLKIGVSFAGVSLNPKRDIPLEHLLKLDELENVQLYCFTKDVEAKTLKSFKKNKVINIAEDFKNFADTAAALENLDILVSSDNGVLNLAGAIGKKTLGVFNYHYEFRWYDLTGEDCGWYKSVKPIVNDEYNDWSKSMDKVVEIIKQEFLNK